MFDKLRDRSERVVLFTKISSWKNSIYGLMKLFLAIMSKSWLVFIYACYHIGMALARRASVNTRIEDKKHKYLLVGIIIINSSLAYILYSIYIMAEGSTANYQLIIAIGITAFAIMDITKSIVGIVYSKRKKNLREESINFINLSSSFISLSLTQTVVLSFAFKMDVSQYSATGCIISGIASLLIGIYMILHVTLLRNEQLEEIELESMGGRKEEQGGI